MTRGVFWAGLAASLLAGAAQAASSVHALTISGQASGGVGIFGCATSGPLPSTNFYGGGVPVPVEGYTGCGLAGGVQDAGKASGASTAHSDVTNAFNGGLNIASADATAVEGALGVRATESYTNGFVDGFSYMYSEAGAMWSDALDYGGTGEGYIQALFHIDGALTVSGNADALTRLLYQVGDEPIYTAFRGQAGHGSSDVVTLAGPATGFTSTPTAVFGSQDIASFFHLVDLSKPFDFRMGLYSAAYAAPNSAAVNDFFSTATLTGFRVFDLAGRPMDVHFTGASGTFYDATGAHRISAGVPEPSQWALMILGFGLVGLLARRQPRRRLNPGGAAV